MIPVTLPDAKIQEEIRRSLGEDPKRLEKQIEAFKEWLRCEPHLPKDVDPLLLKNFVRLCKCDLEKCKKKFEKFLAARIKLKPYYVNRNYDENFFNAYPVHRQAVNYPDLTADGYRIGYFRFPKNPDEFNFEHMVHYGFLILDFLLHKDESGGLIIIYDLENITPQHLSKLNIKVMLEMLDITFNVSPVRIKEIHLVRVPLIAEAIVNIAKKILTEKLQNRIQTHRTIEDFQKCLPEKLLPQEYGGNGKSLEKVADDFKEYFVENAKWIKETENLKLIGPIPPNKKKLYSFEEYGMEGTFRKLSID